ncbi:MAG: hypothetical protein H7Z14_11535 [Anaerolineae bacterium]|nr:hypothetical protein [Phycisphaerae bacterium]
MLADFSTFLRWALSIDLFNFFRWVLGTVVTIYATIITLQSLWSWYVWLAGSDRYIGLLRRYLIVHGLRLRFGSFWGDVIICILLTVTFFILWHAHHLLYDLRDRVHANRRLAQMATSSTQVQAKHVQQSK